MEVVIETGPFEYKGGRFKPTGELYEYGGPIENPVKWAKKATLAARLFVGFNVGHQQVYKMKDLIDIVRGERKSRKKEGATFVAQTGIFEHDADFVTHGVVTEKGAQVIIFDMWNTPLKKFSQEMVRLAEKIAKKMRQEIVIVEIQKDGLSLETLGVTA